MGGDGDRSDSRHLSHSAFFYVAFPPVGNGVSCSRGVQVSQVRAHNVISLLLLPVSPK